jgi:general stress protein YciG
MNSVFDPNTETKSPETPDPDEAEAAQREPVSETPKPRRPRGFAAMDRSKVSEIASKGGKAAHAAGTAHQFTSDEARAAGKKGGVAPHVRRGRGPRQSATMPVAEVGESSKEAKSA